MPKAIKTKKIAKDSKRYQTTISPHRFRQRLLSWFAEFGRKTLPWQQNKTSYSVLVSEIMLQQTQVNTVIPYYLRFMHSFPNIRTLAEASEDDVLHHWAGLGYYSRARNLHKTAQIVVDQHAGELPCHLASLIKLPGIGPSTAGALLSLAFNRPATILDGNVKRVLARLAGITQPIDETETLQTLWQIAETYTPKKK